MSTCKRMWSDREVRSMAVHSVENKEDLKVFEHIVDKDGHKRFIEGDIAISTITGVTKDYAKWSLSGSHIMIVLSLSVANTTALTDGQNLCDIELPDWVLAKIKPVVGPIVNYTSASFYASNYTSQSLSVRISKGSTKIQVLVNSNITFNADRVGRIQVDYLIDNE